jgi:hypothetical protein
MDKRYQVFLSSTYADLRDERQRVFQTLMEMDCIPAGMELFPAADEEQWAFIRRIIDDCDYYLLIIGGRYGSLTTEGVSYTEKEFDYACGKGIRVVAFLHKSPEDISVAKSDVNPSARAKLDAFRIKVENGRLVKYWRSADELPGLVALSLSKTIKSYPARGWVRAPHASAEEILGELNELRKRLEVSEQDAAQLRARLAEKSSRAKLASLDSKFVVRGVHSLNRTEQAWRRSVTWGDLFASLAPELLKPANDTGVSRTVARLVGPGGATDENTLQTIKIQLTALGLVNVAYLKTTNGDMALFWSLTKTGLEEMYARRTIKAE